MRNVAHEDHEIAKKISTWSKSRHPFNGLFSWTTWVSRNQKGKSYLDFNEARDNGVAGGSGISWTIMQIICTLLQTDNHVRTSPLNFLQAGCCSWCQTNSVKAL